MFSLVLVSGVAAAQVQNGSFFNNSGPGPRFGPVVAVQSADQTPNGTEAGAITAILPDPALGANTFFVGSPNGGASWSLLGNSVLQNQSVIGAAVRGNTILAATFEQQSFTTTQTGGGT